MLIKSESDTIDYAQEVVKELSKGTVVALFGNLGTGKTFFTKALCLALGCEDTITSPSYVLMNTYHGFYEIYHFDLYRLSEAEELENLGMFECFEKGITIIEWAELALDILPENSIKLEFKFTKNNNRIIRRI